ncbi:pleckstrin homology domain-containing family G member 5-like isoform X4 [Homarus americanus]|uniref:pleckstrin homology domain-containing family G member 5-like isoform X4 n=1 Tax=Homarus americanus TaxID=6706 RepID=UPI001C48171D|nr:pleckstrin homology domain-containing family G member 5-like isoform X4 [Homarus americanus]XP_042222524.1 pleckstrin homology domain-containing family G member 5-like isoform X4 [Homarus americanus]
MDRFRKKLFKSRKNKRKLSSEPEALDLVVANQYDFDQEGSEDSEKTKKKETFSIRRRTSDGELYSQRREHQKKLSIHGAFSNLSLNTERTKTVYEIESGGHEKTTSREVYRKKSVKYKVEGCHRNSGRPRTLNERELEVLKSEKSYFKQRKTSTHSCKSLGGRSAGRENVQIYVDGIPRGDSVGEDENLDESKDDNDTDHDDYSTNDDEDITPTDATSTDYSSADVTPTHSREQIFSGGGQKFSTVRRRNHGVSKYFLRSRLRWSTKSLGLAAQPAVSSAFSLPHINQLSDYEDDSTTQHHDPSPADIHYDHENLLKPTNKRSDKTKKTKLKRRRAYYRTPKDGRSKSLTHIDTLDDSAMLLSGEDMDGREGPTDKLGVPDPHSIRRRKLSLATKVSSCEYMVLILECFLDPVEEFVQASRGTTLREALERRGLDVSAILVYTEGSRLPLPLNTDTYVLGGKTIRVRARDESRSPVRSRSAGTPGAQPHRKISSSHRGGQGRFPWGGTSTEDCSPMTDERTNGGTSASHEGSLKAARSNKQNNRWSSIFPSKDSKMDSLVQQLDLYSKQGIPRQPHLLASQSPGNDDEVVVEDSWRTLVEGHEQLDERQEQQQSAIWELVETEATYIHMLKVITDLFLACLCNLQNESLLYEVDTDKLFSNIQEIYCANLTFWREHVVRMLEASRSSRQPLDPTLLTDAFYKFDELFHPYTRYCLEQSNCQLYCKEKDHDNEHFKMYLAWCETQKECNRLRLVDILVQPMQRLTKYSLLLKAILKKTNLEDHKLCLHNMITHVENFVSNVNSALRHKHEQERLRDIARRIEAYEAVETRDDELERIVRNYSDLNLTQPMPGCPEHMPRHLLHHGDLRFRDSHTSKMDVHVFLFTDLLLITKVTQRKAEKVKIVRPPYHVERLVLVDLKDSTSIGLVVINEWNVAVAAFTLQCPDSRTHRTWHDTLKRAKEQYKEAQQAQDVMVYDEMTCVGHLVPRSPRPGSSRASRVSSLVHSHSGSIDLNESSPATQHHPSIDMSDVRASSASSDDSVAQPAAEIQRSRSLEGGGCGAISPRPDRRPGYPKTPNTLSVIPPYSTGQSLPNLTVESANSLRVPGTNGSNPKALSPCTRGVSYPPPSPRTLRRSAPVPQSRNPPLTKARHVTSMIGSPQDVDQGEQDDATRGQRRTYRIDRMDNRRYHTAGAIDDIKKQDAKDATIHKRLSWNYGQGPPPTRDLGNDQGKLGCHKHAVKNVSCESVHSSSGVSSTSSLHRSMGSEVEALENIDDNELEDAEATVVDLTVSDCTSLKISPHISTTYICHDSDITLGVCSQYITQPNSSLEPSEGCENLVKIDVSETDPGISSVQITVTEGAASSSSSNLSSTKSPESAPAKPDNTRMKEILLNDASVEASDV